MPIISYSGYVFRVVPYKYRDSLLSVNGALTQGGRYNPPNEFGVLYTSDTQATAFREVNALFEDSDGRLIGVPRNPDLILTLSVDLLRVVDLRDKPTRETFGTSLAELTSNSPSRHILNSRGLPTQTQLLGKACYVSGRVSAIIAPSAAHSEGFCLDIFPDRLIKGEFAQILDQHGEISEAITGQI